MIKTTKSRVMESWLRRQAVFSGIRSTGKSKLLYDIMVYYSRCQIDHINADRHILSNKYKHQLFKHTTKRNMLFMPKELVSIIIEYSTILQRNHNCICKAHMRVRRNSTEYFDHRLESTTILKTRLVN